MILALLLVSANSFADITCGGRFKKALYPYAKAPDGCSSWSNNPYQVRDTWGLVDFRPACNEHDRCYYTLGSDANDCNARFCRHLSRACEKQFKTKYGLVVMINPLIVSCYAIAASYCGAVKLAQSDAHEAAQDMQREWEQCYDQ